MVVKLVSINNFAIFELLWHVPRVLLKTLYVNVSTQFLIKGIALTSPFPCPPHNVDSPLCLLLGSGLDRCQPHPNHR